MERRGTPQRRSGLDVLQQEHGDLALDGWTRRQEPVSGQPALGGHPEGEPFRLHQVFRLETRVEEIGELSIDRRVGLPEEEVGSPGRAGGFEGEGPIVGREGDLAGSETARERRMAPLAEDRIHQDELATPALAADGNQPPSGGGDA